MTTPDQDKARVARAQALRSIVEDWAAELQWIEIQARTARAKYLALTKEGFTPQEALFLCKQ